MVVAEFGQDAGAGEGAEAGEAGDDFGVLVGGEGRGGGCFEVVGAGAGRVELPQQSEGFGAHGLLDHGWLVHLRLAQQRVKAFDLAGDLPLASGLLQDRSQLGAGELGSLGRCGGRGEQNTGDG